MLSKYLPTFRRIISDVLGDTKMVLVLAIILFAIGVLVSYIVASTAAARKTTQYESTVDMAHEDFTNHIHTRIASYQTLLRGAAGLIELKDRDHLTATTWRHYVEVLRSEKGLDDLQGIGFAEFINESDLPAYRDRMQREHGFEVTMRPDTPRDTYTSISYIEPLDIDNRRAIGYDMMSDPVRGDAMMQARDHGKTSLTAPVISVQDMTKDNPPKTILAYFPVYRSGSSIPTTTDERQRSIVGFSYLLFRSSDLLPEYRTATNDGRSYFDIVDITDPSDTQPVYRSDDYHSEGHHIVSKTIDVGERKWSVSLYLDETEPNAFVGPNWLFGFGLLISLLIASSIYLLLRHRNKLIEEEHHRSLNQARNDLVALASHQLRTPATGTRQYIGMLIEGFFGPLNDEQISVAQRAYNANERQLEIVDEILYVAKAESGQIFLNYDEVDIVKLLRDITANSHDDAQKKNIDIKFVSIRKKLLVDIDSKYVTMSLENLLDNSIKYSYPDSTVTVRVAAPTSNQVRITFIDSGVGIDDKDMGRLFDKFARIDNPLSASEGGSGLGLYLAEKLINAHGGSISVDSVVGKGSKFTVTLPIRNDSNENVVQLTERS